MAKKILVIEDEAQTRELFLNCLRFENFCALGAENGSTGIKLAQAHHPDVIVCDIMMPDMDGYDVLSTLHQAPETASIPFIFLTAKVTMADLRYGMTLGADDYLTKPCTIEQFLMAIAIRMKRKSDLNQGCQKLDSKTIQTGFTKPSLERSPNNSGHRSYSSMTPSNIFPDCPQLKSIFNFIETHYYQPINLNDVAEVAGYSPAYLTNLVHAQTGKTIKQWIIERRMAQARILLAHTVQSIKQIAESAGYPDASYFTRQFHKFHGVSPQVWRNNSVAELTK